MKAHASSYLRHLPKGKVQWFDEATGRPLSAPMDPNDLSAQGAQMSSQQLSRIREAQRRELETIHRSEASVYVPEQAPAHHYVGPNRTRQEGFADSVIDAMTTATVNARTGAVSLAVPGTKSGA